MRRKACKLFTLITVVLLSACSSDPQPSKINLVQFGAITQGRQFVPEHLPHFATARVDASGKVANPADFIRQLNNIYYASKGLFTSNFHTYNKVTAWVQAGGKLDNLANYGLQFRQMRGEDGLQNVLMTGYYVPVIPARLQAQGEFRYPIYAIPRSNKKYSRQQIYQGALNGRGLEMVYTNSMLENFLMEVQGSGFVDLGGGQLRHLAYGDKNGYSYTSVGRLLVEAGEITKEKMSVQAIRDWAAKNPHRLQGLLEQNRSFVYFRHDPTLDVKGSAGVPLVALASVASDKRIVPTGSVLLVEMPLIDYHGNWTGQHELRLMVALDVGGAVKNQHFDIYQGIGEKAGHQAGLMKHYGRVWLLN